MVTGPNRQHADPDRAAIALAPAAVVDQRESLTHGTWNWRDKIWFKFNTQAVLAILSLFLAACGAVLVWKGIRDIGSIDVTTPFVTGKMQSGFVGVTFIFLSLAVAGLMALVATKKTSVPSGQRSVQELIVEGHGWNVSYKGAQFMPHDWGKFATMLVQLNQPEYRSEVPEPMLPDEPPNSALEPTDRS